MGLVAKSIAITLAIVVLGGCKVRIQLPEGGYVLSASGNYDCTPDTVDSLLHAHHAGEEDPPHCDIDISDTSFSETFTAVANPGWKFKKWRKRKNGLFGGHKKSDVPVYTIGFEGSELLMSILESDTVYYLEPVFRKIEDTPGNTDCSVYDGSFERIQSIIFEGYNCTNSACHSASAAAGGLDLSPGAAYDSLFRVPASANLVEPMQLVYPGEQKLSFLYSKLAAATYGSLLPPGGGSPMPLASAPLTPDHLEAMRLWIRNGAPESNNVDEVATLLGCAEGTAAQANKIEPPAPPPAGEGVQFVSGPWTVLPNSENEVCFATYYDLEQTPKLLPEWAKAPCEGNVYRDYDGSCMAINASALVQDPQSHHSIIDVYTGTASPFDPAWGDWQCLNGPHQGMACDPTRIGVPVTDGGADCGGPYTACGTQPVRSIACTGWGPADRRTHLDSMGGAQAPVSTSTLAEGVYKLLPTSGIITWNSHAFNLSAQATTVEQYNSFWFAPPAERRYRNRGIFDARNIFVANVPPYEQRGYCSTYTLPRGARLTSLSSHAHKRGILWQTWLPPQDPQCTVQSNCKPQKTAPDYVSRVYNDPLQLTYDPPLAYDSAQASERTLKFCVTYDNGKDFPELLKRNSTSVGSTCFNNAFCAGGPNPGLSCGADDGLCGEGGSCDACIVRGGFTTEDEMFLMLGSFYVVPPEERN